MKESLEEIILRHRSTIDEILNDKSSYYRSFNVLKKSKGFRKINQPLNLLFEIHEILRNKISNLNRNHQLAHGFINGRGIVSNASRHINKDVVLNLDLKDFFDTISKNRIYSNFDNEFQNKELLGIFADIVTYENRLPQGSPCSPAISNIVCYSLDSKLSDYSILNGLTYSRYADDLTFSFGNTYKIQQYIFEIIDIIQSEGFIINARKIRYYRNNKRQIVTGLVVNEKLNVKRELIKNVRAILYNWENKGYEYCTNVFNQKFTDKSKFTETLEGWIDFIGQIRGKEDKLFVQLKTHFRILKAKTELATDNEVHNINLLFFKSFFDIPTLKLYTDKLHEDVFVHFENERKLIIKIWKKDCLKLKENQNQKFSIKFFPKIENAKYDRIQIILNQKKKTA